MFTFFCKITEQILWIFGKTKVLLYIVWQELLLNLSYFEKNEFLLC